jgi:hypothetical protein
MPPPRAGLRRKRTLRGDDCGSEVGSDFAVRAARRDRAREMEPGLARLRVVEPARRLETFVGVAQDRLRRGMVAFCASSAP